MRCKSTGLPSYSHTAPRHAVPARLCPSHFPAQISPLCGLSVSWPTTGSCLVPAHSALFSEGPEWVLRKEGGREGGSNKQVIGSHQVPGGF